MKKITLLLFAVICAVMSGYAEKLYLQRGEQVDYMSGDALVAVWCQGGNSEAWAEFEQVPDVEGLSVAEIPDGTTKITIVRFNSSVTTPAWGNNEVIWNQTGDIKKSINQNIITLTEWNDANSWENEQGINYWGCSWSFYSDKTIPANTQLYFKPNANWATGAARFAICFKKNNNDEAWMSLSEIEGSGVYSCFSPDDTYNYLIICRMNPDATENDWNSKWDQTINLIFDGINNLFTVNDEEWNNALGIWSVYVANQPSVEFAVSELLPANATVTLTAVSENVSDPVYVYSVKQGDDEYIVLEGDTWTPTATGAYTVKVEVKEGAEGEVVAFKEVSTTVVNPIVADTKLYLTPNANWKADNARFAAYFYAGMASAWEDMKKVEGTDMYEVTVPAEGPWTTVIFCRMNPNYTENQWNSGEEGAPQYVWNQSSDLTYDGANNHYTIAEGAWSKGDGTWSLYEEEQGPSTIVEVTENVSLFSINGRTLNVVMDNEAEISIYTISGQMIEHTVASNFTREMQQGVYVIRIGNQSQKLVVF